MTEFKGHHVVRRETAKMRVLSVLQTKGGEATFEDLEEELQGFDGNLWIHHGHPNCVLWKVEHNYGVAISELIANGECGIKPTQMNDYRSSKMLSYIENGESLPMPMAKTVGNYSEPHWYPAKLVLSDSSLNVIATDNLSDSAAKIVKAVRG